MGQVAATVKARILAETVAGEHTDILLAQKRDKAKDAERDPSSVAV